MPTIACLALFTCHLWFPGAQAVADRLVAGLAIGAVPRYPGEAGTGNAPPPTAGSHHKICESQNPEVKNWKTKCTSGREAAAVRGVNWEKIGDLQSSMLPKLNGIRGQGPTQNFWPPLSTCGNNVATDASAQGPHQRIF